MGRVTRRYVNIMNGNRFKELVEQEEREAEADSGDTNE